ncbi:F420-non-reducing hydrogenase iron-sulfur subunit A [Geobacter sp. OR-1]|uniref:Ni/Fe hydrogenase subunit alpha n=1 Tax=Geobacter sp. OR-1 TaxID=1266765 RepID=UPI000542B0AE|nr:Ni/Fe hydrogenase subunit alpha [Geobacter sp. OR-1]GAM09903.1 F420-non-reducing hydrogenase iron-sulfur subunit A [Geobacter sp. OR-1]
MSERIVIDPITRLEGHGRIEIFLDGQGNVSDAFWQVLELRGFERFCIGRPAEEMTRIAPVICGICPSAHHMAACKALDRLYDVVPPPTAMLVRELEYNASIVDDHLLHFFFLAAPDFIVGPDADPAERNIFGVMERLGKDFGRRLIDIRKKNRDIIRLLFSKAPHPEGGVPGGVPRGIKEEERQWLAATAAESVAFVVEALEVFRERVLGDAGCRSLLEDSAYSVRCCSLALVDAGDRVAFYDGTVRVVNAEGREISRFPSDEYADKIAEWVMPWTMVKMTYLRELGWQGLVEGSDSPLYRVGPLARVTVADSMATPLAQQELERFRNFFGPEPTHQILSSHWARLICALQAAERNRELVGEPLLTGSDTRNMDFNLTGRGIGCVEAPRGTLFHHYETDERGILTMVNLIVATQNNAGPISLAIKKAAKRFIRGGEVREGLLNRVEMAFRAFDPCQSCATHALAGRFPLRLNIRDHQGRIILRLNQ